MILIHPSWRALQRFAHEELDPVRLRRVSGHLAKCQRCRDAVAATRSVRLALRELPPRTPPADMIDRILAQRAAGRRGILPIADPPARESVPLVPVALCAGIALIVAIGLLRQPGETIAGRSGLHMTPARPTAGATMTLVYRPAAELALEERLRVRARFRDRDAMPGERGRVVSDAVTLERASDGTFRGSLRLPDSASFAAFAVEDFAGRFVDSNGERLWEVLEHGPDGSPTFDALTQRIADVAPRNWESSYQTVRERAKLYPDRVASWRALVDYELELADSLRRDSVRAAYRGRFDQLERGLAAKAAPPPDEIGDLSRFAVAIGNTAAAARWRTRLLARAPASPAALEVRALAVRDSLRVALRDSFSQSRQREVAQLLGALDATWSTALAWGNPLPAYYVAMTGFSASLAARDSTAVLAWADRAAAVWPPSRPSLTTTLVRQPSLRAAAVGRLEANLQRLAVTTDDERALHLNVTEQREANRLVSRPLLVALGRALLAGGQRAAALDTLDRAAAIGWDAADFRSIAEVYLEAADTARAARMFAWAAADANTGSALADSLRRRVTPWVGAPRWTALLADGADEMRRRVMSTSVALPLDDAVTLTDSLGVLRPLRELRRGAIVVIAYWSRQCGPSLQDLAELNRLYPSFDSLGVRLLAVTGEPDSPELRRFLAARGVRLPVFHDTDGALARELGQWATPTYWVIDRGGALRFARSSLTGARQQIAALREGDRPTLADRPVPSDPPNLHSPE